MFLMSKRQQGFLRCCALYCVLAFQAIWCTLLYWFNISGVTKMWGVYVLSQPQGILKLLQWSYVELKKLRQCYFFPLL